MKRKTLLITCGICTLAIGILVTASTFTYALYQRTQEIKDNYQTDNILAVTGEDLITTFTLELHHANLTNNFHGQYICMVFYTTNGVINTSTTKVVGLTCNYTWDNVTMFYNIKGLTADYKYAVMARCAPGTSPVLSEVEYAVNNKDRRAYQDLRNITNPVDITNKKTSNDVFRVYDGSDSNISQGYYHLEFNPEGTINHIS